MKLVFTKSPEKTNPMKLSVPRLIALFLIACTPTHHGGQKSKPPGRYSFIRKSFQAHPRFKYRTFHFNC